MISNPKMQVLVDVVNNRVPMWTANEYVIQNVSRDLEAGTLLGSLYDFDIIVQDLDHDGIMILENLAVSVMGVLRPSPTNTVFLVTIPISFNNLSDDPMDLFLAVGELIVSENEVCQDYGDKTLEATKIDLELQQEFPDDIGGSYSITLQAEVRCRRDRMQ